VLFQAPQAALAVSGTTTPQTFIKRCVGAPGDIVEMRQAKLYRNGVVVPEPHVIWKDPAPLGMPAPTYMYDMKIVDGVVYSREYLLSASEPGPWTHGGMVVPEADEKLINMAKPGKVPEGMFLMLGDHRNNSNDSHVWGFVPRSLIFGRAMGIVLPWARRREL
jgi:signal peptidase I